MAARNIPLTGPEFEPRSPTWARASARDRLRYWTRLGEIAVRRKRWETLRGIAADGSKLPPVKKRSRPDGATGKPLDPHYAESRTYRLLAARPTERGVTLFWRGHGRKSWSTVLGYHADGLVKGAPVRDVIGISPAGRKAVAREARTFWDTIRPREGKAPPAKPGPPGAKVVTVSRVNPRSKQIQVVVTPPRRPRPPGPAPRPMAPPAAPAPAAGAKAAPEVRTKPAPVPYTQTPARVEALRAKLAGYTAGDAKVRAIAGGGAEYSRRYDVVQARKADAKGALARLKGTKGAARAKALAAVADADARLAEARRDLRAVEGRTRHAALQAIGVPGGAGLEVRHGGTLGGLEATTRDQADAALAWLRRVAAAGPAGGVDVRFAMLPKGETRPYYDAGAVHLNPSGAARTAVHELGHALEAQVPGWGNAAQAFLRHRVGDEPLTRLRSLGLPAAEFEADEWGRRDRFTDAFGDDGWYVGKDYGFEASEVTSMGLERLFTDPVNFARKDPEFCKFVLGLLDGSLR